MGGDTHPEETCEICGRPNVTWFAPSPIWNAAFIQFSGNGTGVACPVCFIKAAERVGFNKDAWVVKPESYVDEPAAVGGSYLNMDCGGCGRRRVLWDGVCEKCGLENAAPVGGDDERTPHDAVYCVAYLEEAATCATIFGEPFCNVLKDTVAHMTAALADVARLREGLKVSGDDVFNTELDDWASATPFGYNVQDQRHYVRERLRRMAREIQRHRALVGGGK